MCLFVFLLFLAYLLMDYASDGQGLLAIAARFSMGQCRPYCAVDHIGSFFMQGMEPSDHMSTSSATCAKRNSGLAPCGLRKAMDLSARNSVVFAQSLIRTKRIY